MIKSRVGNSQNSKDFNFQDYPRLIFLFNRNSCHSTWKNGLTEVAKELISIHEKKKFEEYLLERKVYAWEELFPDLMRSEPWEVRL